MKLTITTKQLRESLRKIVEDYYYGKDQYLDDHDLFNYEPSQDEIDRFNSFDSSGITPIKNKPKKKYGGYAKLYYVYPDGRKELIKRGPIGVVQQLKKRRIETDMSHKEAYVIEFEEL